MAALGAFTSTLLMQLRAAVAVPRWRCYERSFDFATAALSVADIAADIAVRAARAVDAAPAP